MTERICSIEGCEGIARKRGWCRTHYSRWQRHGDPLAVYRPPSAESRFWANVAKTDGCWLWTAATNSEGYGHFSVDGRLRSAHRFSYELLIGPVPIGRELDHLCRTTGCVNPAHLEPVTHRENVRRGALADVTARRNREKTHCANGHPYDEANTYIRPDGKGRDCRRCKTERMAAYHARQRERR